MSKLLGDDILSDPDENILLGLVKERLTSVPFNLWGAFFPYLLAVWQFIEVKRPGVLGQLDASYDNEPDAEPYFEGKGAEWFTQVLFNYEPFIVKLEQISKGMVEDLVTKKHILERGFLLLEEVPTIDSDIVKELALIVLAQVDRGVVNKAIF
jgi:hypothetical protein